MTCQVVENYSAVIGDGNERRESIHANHVEMVKFNGREAGYKAIVFAIKMLVVSNSMCSALLMISRLIDCYE